MNNIGSPASRRSKQTSNLFVTVGTDLPFDRLVQAIDTWAERNPEVTVFAQIGRSEFRPQHIAYSAFLEPLEFHQKFEQADLIVSHAGMGTILSALRYEKPLLVMPRKASRGEHRNEHQLATAKYLTELNKVNVAEDEDELLSILDRVDGLPAKDRIGPHASESLTNAIAEVIASAAKK